MPGLRQFPSAFAAFLAEHLRLRLDRARATISRPGNGGWFRPARIHLLQVEDGLFDFEHPALGRRQIGAGEAIIIMPTTRYFIRVHSPEAAPIRYAHLDVIFFGSLHLDDLATLPPLLAAPDGQALGDAIAAAEQARVGLSTTDLGSLAREAEACARLQTELLRHAQLSESGAATLQGAYRLAPVLHFMQDHLEEPLTRQDLARAADLSPSRFSAVFSQALGLSPMRFLRHLRLQRARLLLAAEGARVQDVAERLCFTDAFHFSKSFKAAYGVSPRDFQQETFAS